MAAGVWPAWGRSMKVGGIAGVQAIVVRRSDLKLSVDSLLASLSWAAIPGLLFVNIRRYSTDDKTLEAIRLQTDIFDLCIDLSISLV